MKKILSALVALSGLFATGCMTDEVTGINTQAPDYIGFEATTTRAAVAGLSTMQDDAAGFRVYAVSDDAPAGWYNDGDGGRIDGSNSHKWDGSKWKFTPQVKWPAASGYPMKFYAMYPANPAGLGSISGSYSPQFGIPYTVQPVAAAQVDLLAARATAFNKPASGSLPLTFRHILSKVAFGIVNGYGVNVQVQSISVVNVGDTRTYDLVNGQWLDKATGSAAHLYDSNDNLMLMPQTSESWKPVGGSAPTGLSGGYVSVIYRMSTGNGTTGNGDPREVGFADASQYPGGSGGVTGALFVKAGFPLSANADGDFVWEPGRSYTYNIGLGTPGSCNGYILDEYYYNAAGNSTPLKLVEVKNEGKRVGDKLQDGAIRVTLTTDDWGNTEINLETPRLTLTPDTYTFPQTGGMKVFMVDTNAQWWNISDSNLPTGYHIEENWLDSTVEVTAPVNGSVSPLKDYSFTVEASNGCEVTVTLKQDALIPTLSVDPATWEFSQSGETKVFTVATNASSWIVSSKDLPETYILTSDPTAGTVTVKAPANDSFTPVVGRSFTVMSSHGSEVTVTVEQKAKPAVPTITVNPTSLMFPADPKTAAEGIRSVRVTLENVQPGTTWTAEKPGQIEHYVLQYDNNDPYLFRLMAFENKASYDITGKVIVTAMYGGQDITFVEIPVHQAAKISLPTLSVSPTAHTFPQAGGTQMFNVSMNAISWSITSSLPAGYIVAHDVQGSTITVTAPANGATNTLNGTIVVTTSHNPALTATITINQTAKVLTPTITVSPVAYTFPQNGGTQQFSVGTTNAASWSIASKNLPSGYTLATSGTNTTSGTVTVTAPANGSTNTLSGYSFTVFANGATQTVPISQSPSVAPKNFTSVSPTHLTFAQSGGSLPVFAQSSSSMAGLSGVHTPNSTYTPYSVGAASLTNNNLYGTMYVNAPANTTLGTRYGRVTVSAPGYHSKTVTTSQSGRTAWDQATISNTVYGGLSVKLSTWAPTIIEIWVNNMMILGGTLPANQTLKEIFDATTTYPAGVDVTLRITWEAEDGNKYTDTLFVGRLGPGNLRYFSWNEHHKW